MSLLCRHAVRHTWRQPLRSALAGGRREFSQFYTDPRPTDDIVTPPRPMKSTPEEQLAAEQRWEGMKYEFADLITGADEYNQNGAPVLQDPYTMHHQPLPVKRQPFYYVTPWNVKRAAPRWQMHVAQAMHAALFMGIFTALYYETWENETTRGPSDHLPPGEPKGYMNMLA